MVVAVDVSGVTATRSNYNSKTLLIVAREAVQYVIDTLNPNDRVGKIDILRVVFFLLTIKKILNGKYSMTTNLNIDH